MPALSPPPPHPHFLTELYMLLIRNILIFGTGILSRCFKLFHFQSSKLIFSIFPDWNFFTGFWQGYLAILATERPGDSCQYTGISVTSVKCFMGVWQRYLATERPGDSCQYTRISVTSVNECKFSPRGFYGRHKL